MARGGRGGGRARGAQFRSCCRDNAFDGWILPRWPRSLARCPAGREASESTGLGSGVGSRPRTRPNKTARLTERARRYAAAEGFRSGRGLPGGLPVAGFRIGLMAVWHTPRPNESEIKKEGGGPLQGHCAIAFPVRRDAGPLQEFPRSQPRQRDGAVRRGVRGQLPARAAYGLPAYMLMTVPPWLRCCSVTPAGPAERSERCWETCAGPPPRGWRPCRDGPVYRQLLHAAPRRARAPGGAPGAPACGGAHPYSSLAAETS